MYLIIHIAWMRFDEGEWALQMTIHCTGSTSGKYSSFGDSEWMWTSSAAPDNSSYAWSVRFEYGRIDYDSRGFTHFVRCVLPQMK
jgi:hypothetical protein